MFNQKVEGFLELALVEGPLGSLTTRSYGGALILDGPKLTWMLLLKREKLPLLG